MNIGEVYTFKLNSGEEVVAKIMEINSDKNEVIISNPVSIAPNQKGIGLMPSMFTADPDSNVKLNTNSVSIIAPTEDSVKVKYIEATTGITVPDKKLILG
jgi:hypothetical protein